MMSIESPILVAISITTLTCFITCAFYLYGQLINLYRSEEYESLATRRYQSHCSITS